jgi:predicted peptidase
MIAWETLESRLHLSRVATRFARSTESLAASPSISLTAPMLSAATDLTGSITGTASDGKLSIPYRLFVPQLPTPAQQAPLILVLHGNGDAGTDNVSQTFWMSNLRANTAAGQYAAYVLAPQIPLGKAWYSTGRHPAQIESLVISLVRQILSSRPNVDPARIYLTGVSAGALGVWDLLQRNPTFFAAGVPMSGAINASIAPRLKRIPIWAFHGAADTGVLPISTRQMIAAIIKAGGSPWYTEVPGGGHFIWDGVYAMPSLYAWMFAQHLAPKGR